MDRYFIVFYVAEKGIFGTTSFKTNGCYIGLYKTAEQIEERHNIKNVVLTNILEVSESDFNDYNL